MGLRPAQWLRDQNQGRETKEERGSEEEKKKKKRGENEGER